MNPLDLPFEKKVEMLTNNNCIPVGVGVNFKKFIELDRKNIRQKTGSGMLNIVRSKGLDQEVVDKFKEHILTGKYQFNHQQPVVCAIEGNDELYELVCGEHRYNAHGTAKRSSMLVALVEFDTLEDKLIFQSNENDPEDIYIKNPRSREDVLVTLKGMVDAGIIDINDDKSINLRLSRLNQRDNDFPKLREELRKKFNILSAVKSYDGVQRNDWCKEYKPEIRFSTRNKIVSMNGTAYVSKTFKGGSGSGGVRDLDYDPRCFFDVCTMLQNEKVDEVCVVASVNDSTAKKITNIREYKRNKMMQEWMDRCCSIVDDYRAGKIDPAKTCSFKFVPQINKVDDLEDWA